MAKKTNRKIAFKEWIWYLISAVFIAWGVTEMICGLVLEYATGSVTKWPLYGANTRYTELFGLGFLHWGIILMIIGVVLGAIVLCIYATSYDREAEKESRRAARLHNKTEEVKDVEVKEPETAKVEKVETPAPEQKAQ